MQHSPQDELDGDGGQGGRGGQEVDQRLASVPGAHSRGRVTQREAGSRRASPGRRGAAHRGIGSVGPGEQRPAPAIRSPRPGAGGRVGAAADGGGPGAGPGHRQRRHPEQAVDRGPHVADGLGPVREDGGEPGPSPEPGGGGELGGLRRRSPRSR